MVVRGKRRGREDGEGSDDHEGHVVNVAATNAATGLSEAAAPAAADVSAANAIAALALSEPAKAAGSGTGRNPVLVDIRLVTVNRHARCSL